MAKINMGNGIVFEGTAQECAEFKLACGLKGVEKSKKATGRKAQPKAEKVAFTKHDGTVIYGTQKQVDAWTKWANREFKPLDEVKAEFEENRKAYKPSKALIEAIKRDRASVTRKVAKEQYGFIGTKDDLKALKAEVLK